MDSRNQEMENTKGEEYHEKKMTWKRLFNIKQRQEAEEINHFLHRLQKHLQFLLKYLRVYI